MGRVKRLKKMEVLSSALHCFYIVACEIASNKESYIYIKKKFCPSFSLAVTPLSNWEHSDIVTQSPTGHEKDNRMCGGVRFQVRGCITFAE